MKSTLPMIGQDLSYSDVGKQGALVRDFTAFGSIEENQLKGPSVPLPYGLLRIDLHIAPGTEAELPIVHKSDFRLAWKVFVERELKPSDLDIWVFYVPRFSTRFLGWLNRFLPRLQFFASEKGYLGSSRFGGGPVDYATAYFEKFDHGY